MYAIFDHLTAIVIGTILLMTIFILQMRQSQSAVDETIHSSVWEHVHEAVEIVRNDTANLMNEDQATKDFPSGLVPIVAVDTTASGGLTQRFLFPARVRDTVGDTLVPAQVGYRLVPHLNLSSSPVDTFTVRMNGEDRPLFRLQRAVLKVTDMTGLPSAVPDPSLYQDITANLLVDFEIGLIGSALEPRRSGSAPDGFSAVRIAATGGLDRLDAISSEQANTRETNGVRITATARPVNL